MALLPRLATAALLLSALAACGGSGSSANGERLTIAATAVPHAEILEVVKPLLAEQGVDLQVRIFNDYVQPNDQVAQGSNARDPRRSAPSCRSTRTAAHPCRRRPKLSSRLITFNTCWRWRMATWRLPLPPIAATPKPNAPTSTT